MRKIFTVFVFIGVFVAVQSVKGQLYKTKNLPTSNCKGSSPDINLFDYVNHRNEVSFSIMNVYSHVYYPSSIGSNGVLAINGLPNGEYVIEASKTFSSGLNKVNLGNIKVDVPTIISSLSPDQDKIFCLWGTENYRLSHNKLQVKVTSYFNTFKWNKEDYSNILVKDGTSTTADSLVFAINEPRVAGKYYCRIDGMCGTAVTRWFDVKFYKPLRVIKPLEDHLTICEGGEATFSIEVADGGGEYWYYWIVDIGSKTYPDIIGSGGMWAEVSHDSNKLKYFNTTRSMDNTFTYVEVYSKCNFIESNRTQVKVILRPVITQQPQDVVVCKNGTAQLSVDATGEGQDYFTYTWRRVGYPNPVGSSKTLTLTSIQPESAGKYFCVVTGRCPHSSDTVNVSLYPEVKITQQPESKTVCEGQATVLSVTNVGGTGLITYQWYQESSPGTYVPVPLSEINGNSQGPQLSLNGLPKSANNRGYKVAISDYCQTPVYSTIARITVQSPPVIVKQDFAAYVCRNSSVNVSINTTGEDITYQWTMITPRFTTVSSTKDLHIDNFQISDHGIYYCSARNSCGWVRSTNIIVFIYKEVEITQQPANQSACEGGDASFSVEAKAGHGFLSYNWEYEQTPGNYVALAGGIYSGTTGKNLYLKGIPKSEDNRKYRVSVQDGCSNAVKSNSAQILLKYAPVVLVQPKSFEACKQGTGEFQLTTSGYDLSFDWKKSGRGTIGQSSNVALFLNLQPADVGEYYCVVSNNCGSAISNKATIKLYDDVKITQQPLPQSICEGGNTFFSVEAKPSYGSLSYRWDYDDGSGTFSPVPTNALYGGTVSKELLVKKAPKSEDSRKFRVSISDGCAVAVRSNVVALTVNSAPVIEIQPLPFAGCIGTSPLIYVSAGGYGNTYVWKKTNGGEKIFGVSNVLSLENINTESVGSYFCTITNNCGTATSNAGEITLFDPVRITKLPKSQTVCEGENTSFSAGGIGHGAIKYEWEYSADGTLDWKPLASNGVYADAKTYNLLLNSVPYTENKKYFRVKISDDCSAISKLFAISSPIQLTVALAPAITEQPLDLLICRGGVAQFKVAATSDFGLQYEWQVSENGNFVAIATQDQDYANTKTETLRIVKSKSTERVYRAKVSNNCPTPKSNYSDNVTLALYQDVEITTGLKDGNVCSEVSTDLEVKAKSGFGTLSYLWQSRPTENDAWQDIVAGGGGNNFNAATFNLDNSLVSDNGLNVRVLVRDGCYATNTYQAESKARLILNQAPHVANISRDLKVCAGVDVSLEATATGATTLVWQHSGEITSKSEFADLANQTDVSVLNLPQVLVSQAGLYRLKAVNNCNTIAVGQPILLEVFPHSDLNIGSDLEFCAKDDAYNLAQDKLPAGVSGQYWWLENGAVITNSIFDPKLYSVGQYTVTFTPDDRLPTTCYNEMTRIVKIKSEGGRGNLNFTTGNTVTMCPESKQMQLSEIVNDKSGSWAMIKNGQVMQMDEADYTLSPNQPASENPTMYRYSSMDNGCRVSLDLQVFHSDNKNKITLPPIGKVCPGTTIELEPVSSLPNQSIYYFYDNASGKLLSKGYYSEFEVKKNSAVKITSINNYGCESKATIVELGTVFDFSQIIMSHYTANLGDKVEFSYLGTDESLLFAWDFDDGIKIIKKEIAHYFYTPGIYNIKLELTSPIGCKRLITKELVIKGDLYNPFPKVEASDVTGINNDPDNGILLWPNPVANTLYLDGKVNKFLLRDLSGHVLMDINNRVIKSVNLELLTTGVYIIELENGNSKSIQKIIKY